MATINFDYYNSQHHYSDGDIEERLLDYFKGNIALTDVPQDWAVFYHLSPLRRNLLSWYQFEHGADKSLLEIGAGCGALTGLFCEKIAQVKAVELSQRRAEIIYHRHKSYDNLEIIVGNLNDIKFHENYDYITLIGVLEYAAKFTLSDNPYIDFLKYIKKLLKPDGHLIIAIENKLGMKYWAGAREDHTGVLFDSIENYKKFNGVKTFSKLELTKMFQNAGFNNIEYFYPMPDYKIPNIVYSDEFLPEIGSCFNAYSPNYDQSRYGLFNEYLAFQSILQAGLFDEFANSFLIVIQ
jgi:2-polyprenyl-3-methyl-5-hydroxy-6-metoxy-1,4-benzoquinol methylase